MSEEWNGNSECRCTKHHAPRPVSVTLIGDTPVCAEMAAQVNEIHRRWDNKNRLVKSQATGFHRFARELAEKTWVHPRDRAVSDEQALTDWERDLANDGYDATINSPGLPAEDETTSSEG
jgi:hypothetical protein